MQADVESRPFVLVLDPKRRDEVDELEQDECRDRDITRGHNRAHRLDPQLLRVAVEEARGAGRFRLEIPKA